jgi:lambda family phage portal protein
MDRNDAIVGHMIDSAVRNTIQDGMWPDPATGNAEADKLLLARFNAWASDPLACSLNGMLTFVDQQELVFRQTLLDGDIFALPLDVGSLELIESHRCRTPSNTVRDVVLGIMLNEMRQRKEYWFTRDDIDPNTSLSRVSDVARYAAYDDQGWPNVLHIFNPKRVSQTRGVSALVPIFDVAGMFEDIQFAKLVQQQVVSCFTFIRELELNASESASVRLGDQEVDAYADGVRKIVEQIAPGMEITGNPGEKISGFAPQIPNPGAMEHFRLILTMLGVNLGLPLVILLMDASETNFSGWRGAVEQARMGFRRNQRWLIEHFLTPVYQWKVRQWIDTATGDPQLAKLAAQVEAENGDIYGHTWTAPKWPYIQPLQDAQADALRVEKRQTSPRRQLAERGLDIDDIRGEIIGDNTALIMACIEASKQIEQKTGESIDWHELLYVPNVIDQKPGLPSSPTTSIQPEQQGVMTDA